MTEDPKPQGLAQMPLLLRVGMAGSVISSVFTGIVVLVIVFSRNSIFVSNGEQVASAQFFSGGGYLLLLVPILSGGIGYGLWKGRAWTRPLMLLCWVALVAPSVIGLLLGTFDEERHLAALILFPVVIWYLCFKRNVALYYRAISTADAET